MEKGAQVPINRDLGAVNLSISGWVGMIWHGLAYGLPQGFHP